MIAKYIYNKEICGLKKNHEYELKFSKRLKSYVYDCNVIKDLTEDKYLNLTIRFASETSIKQHFKMDRVEMED